MTDLDTSLPHVEVLARQARERIEESLSRLGGDSSAFWHAVALIYRRGLPDVAQAASGAEEGDVGPACPWLVEPQVLTSSHPHP